MGNQHDPPVDLLLRFPHKPTRTIIAAVIDHNDLKRLPQRTESRDTVVRIAKMCDASLSAGMIRENCTVSPPIASVYR